MCYWPSAYITGKTKNTTVYRKTYLVDCNCSYLEELPSLNDETKVDIASTNLTEGLPPNSEINENVSSEGTHANINDEEASVNKEENPPAAEANEENQAPVEKNTEENQASEINEEEKHADTETPVDDESSPDDISENKSDSDTALNKTESNIEDKDNPVENNEGTTDKQEYEGESNNEDSTKVTHEDSSEMPVENEKAEEISGDIITTEAASKVEQSTEHSEEKQAIDEAIVNTEATETHELKSEPLDENTNSKNDDIPPKSPMSRANFANPEPYDEPASNKESVLQENNSEEVSEATDTASTATITYIVIGVAVVAIAAFGLVYYRRKHRYTTVNREDQGKELQEIRTIPHDSNTGSDWPKPTIPEHKPLMYSEPNHDDTDPNQENGNANKMEVPKPKERFQSKEGALEYCGSNIKLIDDDIRKSMIENAGNATTAPGEDEMPKLIPKN